MDRDQIRRLNRMAFGMMIGEMDLKAPEIVEDLRRMVANKERGIALGVEMGFSPETSEQLVEDVLELITELLGEKKETIH
jgi:hypothetical protein